MKHWMLLALAVSLSLLSCASSRADAQLRAAESDILFEYHYVENDSISLLVGNTFRLHTGKTQKGDFYPLLVSVRSPQDLDKPTNTEVLHDPDAVIAFLQKRFQFLKAFGVVIGDNVSTDPKFKRQEAIDRIRELARKVSESTLVIFEEKDGEIVSMQEDN